jgi:hypothetical protein
VSRQDALNRTKHFQRVRGYIRPVPAVFRDDLTMVGNRMISAHPQKDVVIFTPAKRHVEPSGVEQAPAIIHNRPVHADLVASQESDVGVRPDISADWSTRHPAATVDMAKTAVDKTGLRMANEAFEASFDCTLAKPVVSIEKDNFVADRGFQPGVARRGKTPISLTNQTDTGIAGYHRFGIVRRAIIDYLDLAGGD